MNNYSLNKKASTKTRRFFMLSAQVALMLSFAIGTTMSAQTSPLSTPTLGPMTPPANCSNNGTVGLGCGPDTPLIGPTITGNGTNFTGEFPSMLALTTRVDFRAPAPTRVIRAEVTPYFHRPSCPGS